MAFGFYFILAVLGLSASALFIALTIETIEDLKERLK